MRYTNIFIDLDDTLWNTRVNSKRTMATVFTDYGFEKYYENFESFYAIYWNNNCKLWDDYRHGRISRHELIVERFRMPLKRTGRTDEQFILKLNHDFLERTTHQKELLPHAIETLDYLKGKYHLHILSNGFKEVQYAKMENSGLMPYFEKIILSDNVGANKPSPAIFEEAVKEADTSIESSLMIGDSWDADIIGAHDYGMDQIWFNRDKEEAKIFSPTYTIHSLSEIKEIL